MATKQALIESLDAFTRSYLETALWSSNDESNDQGGNPLDENYSIDDFTVEALRESIDDCKSFQAFNLEDLEAVYRANRDNRGTVVYGPGDAGHDFWLTRNGHGAGFWDRGLGEVGDRLSKASEPYGSVNLMVYRGKVTL
jgi:hypothetical protein